jgi:hypothetical protein
VERKGKAINLYPECFCEGIEPIRLSRIFLLFRERLPFIFLVFLAPSSFCLTVSLTKL